MFRQARRDNLLRAGAWLVLLLAVTPNVMYLGHGPLSVAPADAHEASSHAHPGESPAEDTSQAEEHALHCHTGPSSCAGSQSLTGSLWVGEDAGLLSFDATPRVADAGYIATNTETPSHKLLQPPRHVA